MRRLLLLLALLLLSPLGASGAETGNYPQREEVRRFVKEMVEKHGFKKRVLNDLFSRARVQTAIIRAMTRPPESTPRAWQAYRGLFVDPLRVEGGARFSADHAETLARAGREFGIPPEIVVAIIGIETVYGRNMGGYRVFDALTTLAFDFPRRAEYFRGELENYLLYVRDAGVDALAIRGSYAGAIGIPQFMPGSYLRYALDYDGDGRRDLSASAVDAIGSVANFLKEHGWDPGAPIAMPARVVGGDYRQLLDAGIRPAYRRADLALFGVSGAESLPPDTLCALIELETAGQDSEYWIALHNFYVLTRYNRSSFYASAVHELARAIAEAQVQPADVTPPR
ncbi:MAG: lytic murein transglycosylase B [Betaproteobacteria bacterium]|nr:lytic murein transglycosylase B [Betaproteobacteria bacterium]